MGNIEVPKGECDDETNRRCAALIRRWLSVGLERRGLGSDERRPNRAQITKARPTRRLSFKAPARMNRPEVIAPVFRVISVEVMRSSHGTPLDIIRVRGLASTPGWEEAELVPLTRGVPKDGMLELIFVARAPAEAMEATGFEPVEAIFPDRGEPPV